MVDEFQQNNACIEVWDIAPPMDKNIGWRSSLLQKPFLRIYGLFCKSSSTIGGQMQIFVSHPLNTNSLSSYNGLSSLLIARYSLLFYAQLTRPISCLLNKPLWLGSIRTERTRFPPSLVVS